MRTWEDCVAFHGHQCGGLIIGYKACLYAIELLDLEFSEDEQVICISENDACGVDAVQVMLGCSAGKGNLLFHVVGKQAFSFYNRNTGKSVRLVLKPRPEGMTREESFEYYQGCAPMDMFDVKQTSIPLPEKAKLFDSFVCNHCGETTGSNWLCRSMDQKLCMDCYNNADNAAPGAGNPTGRILELNCNVDDMTGEAIAFALEQFREQGAMEVFTVPIGMKKSRPGFLIVLICREEDKEKFVQLIFKHTTTLGIREKTCGSFRLDQKIETVTTPYGQIRKKVSQGYDVHREKFEYEDLARIAKEHNMSLRHVLTEISEKI